MWIVRLALRRPYTFVVMALLIFVLGGLAITTMSTDIFPEINIPVVSVIWSYTGISPDDMEKRVINIAERAMTTTVNGIEHMESQSMNGVGVIKVYFQPNVKIEEAVAEVTAIQQTVLRVLPPNITPPLIIRYSASSVPVLQLAVSSQTLVRAGTLRLQPQLRPPAARHRAGSQRAAALRRQAAADHGGHRLRRALRQGALAQRCHQRAQRPEPHPARRHGEDRPARVPREAQRQPGGGPRSTTCRSRSSTARSSTCATWRRSTTATRCRPTSCARTACARRC